MLSGVDIDNRGHGFERRRLDLFEWKYWGSYFGKAAHGSACLEWRLGNTDVMGGRLSEA